MLMSFTSDCEVLSVWGLSFVEKGRSLHHCDSIEGHTCEFSDGFSHPSIRDWFRIGRTVVLVNPFTKSSIERGGNRIWWMVKTHKTGNQKLQVTMARKPF